MIKSLVTHGSIYVVVSGIMLAKRMANITSVAKQQNIELSRVNHLKTYAASIDVILAKCMCIVYPCYIACLSPESSSSVLKDGCVMNYHESQVLFFQTFLARLVEVHVLTYYNKYQH